MQYAAAMDSRLTLDADPIFTLHLAHRQSLGEMGQDRHSAARQREKEE
jgi:hypothetical protein